ncbi:anti-anti-sigma regulatory factor [Sphingomonas sp. BE123]|uniref:STAS domain-containing protein n=1 Tax=unclassified Sphingomonas TaxID=196159 RepID=UPI002857F187|nr:STAS domain-containing protein [Sphingomonas sp. BE123]MDR6853486.1 anti-anti-sigma regulatory factor [Sphingomonas sp. BE123]
MTSQPNPPELAPSPGGIIGLPAHGVTVTAEELKVRLVLAADAQSDILVDASAVESVGQAVLQLLLAARTEAEANGHRFIIQNPSPAFLARTEALGLTDRLGLSHTEELQS